MHSQNAAAGPLGLPSTSKSAQLTCEVEMSNSWLGHSTEMLQARRPVVYMLACESGDVPRHWVMDMPANDAEQAAPLRGCRSTRQMIGQ